MVRAQQDTTTATNLKGGNPNNFANMHANGTGPFRVVERQPDVKTGLERFGHYWKPIKSNVTKAVMTPSRAGCDAGRGC